MQNDTVTPSPNIIVRRNKKKFVKLAGALRPYGRGRKSETVRIGKHRSAARDNRFAMLLENHMS